MDIQKWKAEQFGVKKKKAMPVLSFPSVSLLNISVKDLISSPDLQSKGMKAIADRCPSSASVSMMDLSVEAEAFGSTVKFSDDEVPTVVGRIIETEEDVDRLIVPKPGAGRTGLYIEAIKKACKLITDRPVFAGVIGPFSLAGRLMDFSEIMPNCYCEPDMVHKTLEKASDFLIAYLKEYKKTGASGYVMAEPAAGLLSPAIAAEFSSAYVDKIAKAVRDDNFIFIYHNCGESVPFILESLLSFKADAYHFGDKINIEEILKKMPKDVPTFGNLSPSAVFLNGSAETVRKETSAMLEKCAKYPNYVPSSGCDIPPLTKWENIDEFFNAVTEFYK